MAKGIDEFSNVYVVHGSYAIIAHRRRLAHQGKLGYNVSSGAVAHRLEQAAHNHLVESSTLSSPTNLI